MMGLFKSVVLFRDAIFRRLFPIKYARHIGVKVGNECRLFNVSFSTEPYLVSLGNHVSATMTHFETHDGGVWVFRGELQNLDVVRGIRVGNNVFIGYGSIILPGVTIGDNVVIGAGSVVSKNIPDNCVAAGVPAKIIKTIDDYRQGCIRNGKDTKSLDVINKRRFYELQSGGGNRPDHG